MNRVKRFLLFFSLLCACGGLLGAQQLFDDPKSLLLLALDITYATHSERIPTPKSSSS
ncbi:MAG: hypothetical protein ACOXZ4_03260 [Sphaerochaetaceae bacterium]